MRAEPRCMGCGVPMDEADWFIKLCADCEEEDDRLHWESLPAEEDPEEDDE